MTQTFRPSLRQFLQRAKKCEFGRLIFALRCSIFEMKPGRLYKAFESANGSPHPPQIWSRSVLTTPTLKIRRWNIAPWKTGQVIVFNLAARAAAPHQKYIRGWVLGWTWNRDSDILPPSIILQGEGWKVQNMAAIADPKSPLTRFR